MSFFETVSKIFNFGSNYIHSIFLMFFGIAFFLIGLFLILSFLYIRIIGKSVLGKVVGGVKDVSVEYDQNDHGTLEKDIDEDYYLIYEYEGEDGLLKLEKSSNSGLSTFKYKTGQSVKLIVLSYKNYDDVYDSSEFKAVYISTFFLFAGMSLIIGAKNIIAFLNFGLLAVIVASIVLAFKVIIANKKDKDIQISSVPLKYFDPKKIQPIEVLEKDYLKMRSIKNKERNKRA